MPNGDDTVQIQMPDGRVLTGPKSKLSIALQMGAKLYDPSKKQSPAEPTGAVAALKELGSGAAAFGKSMLDPRVPVIGKSSINRSGVKVDPNSMAGTFLSGLSEQGQKAKEAFNKGDLLAAGGHGAASVVPGVGPIAARSVEKFEKGDVSGGLVMGGAALLGAKGMLKGERPAVIDPVATSQKAVGIAKNALQTILNEGASREKMQMLQEADALSTKSKLAALDKKVKTDAGNLMQQVAQTVDQKIPQGSVDGEKVSKDLKTDLSTFVKAKTLRAKLPQSVQKILNEAEGSTGAKTAVRLTDREMQTLNLLTRDQSGRAGVTGKLSALPAKKGLAGEELRAALVSMQYTPKQIDAMMQVSGTAGAAPKWGFERAKQLRTELGDELFSGSADNYPGAVRKAMHNAWGNLTKALDSAAESAGVGPDWARAREKWSNYKRDFYGGYERGKYNPSPLNQALQGDTAKDIMDPLSGKGAQKSRDLLRKYAQYMNEQEDVRQDVRRFKTNEKIMQFASPNKWDIIIGLMALARPEYGIPAFLARYGLPRIAEKIVASRAGDMTTARPAAPVSPEANP